MFEYPQYDDDGSEILNFTNIWRDTRPQEILGVDCFQPFAQVYNEQNLVNLRLTGLEYRQLLSSIMLGSQIAYPETWMQIYVNWLKGTHCPPTLEAHECVPYPSYAPFIQYPLQNPFSQPELVPDGYLVPPMVVVNEENQSEYPDNELGDIIVVYNSFPVDTGWFDDIHEDLPAVLINVMGEGSVEIKLLNVPLGGMAIVTVDNPPNLVDILAGIITGAENIIELNLDNLSIPPETAQERIFEVDVVGEGLHTVYIVFFPIIDDSLVPLRFGGGFRGVELCGFMEMPEMGITDLRFYPDAEFNQLRLQKLVTGEWQEIEMGFETAAFWTRTSDKATSALVWAEAIRNLYEYDPTYYGDDGGWLESPLKAYIDAAAGEPFDPSALEAAIAAAAAAAAAAQADADAAQSTANGAVTVNNAQNTEIEVLETDIATLNLDVSILQADTAFLGDRMTSAEARLNDLDNGGAWHHIDDFTSGDQGYTPTFGTYVAGVGFQATTTEIVLEANRVYHNEITNVQVVIETSGVAPTPEIQLGWEGSYISNFYWDGNTPTLANAWLAVPNQNFADDVRWRVRILTGGGTFVVKYVRYLGKGSLNPFI